eukprot:gene15872-17471_t
MKGLGVLILGLCALGITASDPMEDPNLFEGDMILTNDQKLAYLSGEANYQIPLAATKTNLWPTVIPYSLDSTLSSQSRAVSAINAAIADYERLTCLRFVRRTTQSGYLHFYRGGGKQSSSNINSMNVPYDYESVMHYGKTAFGSGKITIQTIDASKQNVIGRRQDSHQMLPPQHQSLRQQLLQPAVMYNSSLRVSGGKNQGSKVTTSAPVVTTTPSPACRDVQKQSSCASWKRQGLCTMDRYKDYMKRNCRLTCGYCGAAGTTAAPACRDVQKQSSCARWKNSGFCTDDRYKDWMKRNCQLTCGYCAGATTRAPTRPPCKDDHASCSYWKQRGLCSCMRQYCRRSCQVCSDATTRPQPVTTRPQPVTTRPQPVTTRPQPVTTRTPVSGSCGQPEVQQSRVIAGINAAKGSWPWQILMLYSGRTSCGGSIVAPNWIVTAAHCVSGREGQASSFKIR